MCQAHHSVPVKHRTFSRFANNFAQMFGLLGVRSSGLKSVYSGGSENTITNCKCCSAFLKQATETCWQRRYQLYAKQITVPSQESSYATHPRHGRRKKSYETPLHSLGCVFIYCAHSQHSLRANPSRLHHRLLKSPNWRQATSCSCNGNLVSSVSRNEEHDNSATDAKRRVQKLPLRSG